jgi:hypothetical protein
LAGSVGFVLVLVRHVGLASGFVLAGCVGFGRLCGFRLVGVVLVCDE